MELGGSCESGMAAAMRPLGLGEVARGPRGSTRLSRSRLMALVSGGGDQGRELGRAPSRLVLLTPSTPPSESPLT